MRVMKDPQHDSNLIEASCQGKDLLVLDNHFYPAFGSRFRAVASSVGPCTSHSPPVLRLIPPASHQAFKTLRLQRIAFTGIYGPHCSEHDLLHPKTSFTS